MANYNVDIQLQVKNLAQLKSFRTELDQLTQKLEAIQKLSKFDGRSVKDRLKARRDEKRLVQEELEARKRLLREQKQQSAEFLRQQRLLLQQRKKGLGQYSGPIGPGEASPAAAAIGASKRLQQAVQEAAGLQVRKEKEITDLELKNDNLVFKKKLADIKRIGQENIKASKRANDAELKDFDTRLRNRTAAKRRSAAQKKQSGKGFQSAALGVGFPLLFGGGPGSIAGGLAGSAFGFGGQILGSAIGQQLDKLGSAALGTARIFTELSVTAKELIPVLGVGRRGGFGGQASFLLGQGRSAQTAAVLRDRFAEVYGESARKQFEELAEASKRFDDSLQGLGVSLQGLTTSTLNAISRVLEGLAPKAPSTPATRNEVNQKRIEQQINTFENLRSLTPANKERLKNLKEQLNVLKEQAKAIDDVTDSEKDLNKATKDRLDFLKTVGGLEASLAQRQLTARRDTLAVDAKRLVVLQAQEKVDNLNSEYEKEKAATGEKSEASLKKLVDLNRARADLTIAEAEGTNRIITVQRQLDKEQLASAASRIKLLNQRQELSLKFEQGEKGRFALYEQEQIQLSKTLDVNLGILDLQEASALLGVVEEEKRTAITRQYELQKQLAKDLYYQQAQALEQANAANDLSKLRVQQEEKLKNLQAGLNAQAQIQQTSPFENQQFLMDPFFGSSNQLQAEQALNYANTLKTLETQLSNVNEQQSIFALSPEIRAGLKDREIALQNEIERFKEYQPAIDEAALAQARFNDALALTAPVVDSIFGNLQAVIEGTKSAEEAFADFLKNIGEMLIQSAAQQIAVYIAIGIARAFAGMGTKAKGDIVQPDAIQSGAGFGLGPKIQVGGAPSLFAAEGAYVTGPTNAVVGEGGEPEYIIPQSKMRESMERYSRGTRGSAVIPAAGDSGASGAGGGVAVAAPIDVRFKVERINNVDYVTAAEFQEGMQQAAKQGAQRGEQQAIKRLQMSSSTRRRVGL